MRATLNSRRQEACIFPASIKRNQEKTAGNFPKVLKESTPKITGNPGLDAGVNISLIPRVELVLTPNTPKVLQTNSLLTEVLSNQLLVLLVNYAVFDFSRSQILDNNPSSIE